MPKQRTYVSAHVSFSGVIWHRKTDRTYTHLVVNTEGEPLSWCGREDLALKQQAVWMKQGTVALIVPITEFMT